MGDVEDAVTGLSLLGVEKAIDVQWLAFQPALEARRGYEAVERHRQLEAVILRIEGVDIENAELVNRWALNRGDQFCQVQILVSAPEMFEDGGEQNGFTASDGIGVDAHKLHQRCHRSVYPLTNELSVFVEIDSRGGQAVDDADGQTGV